MENSFKPIIINDLKIWRLFESEKETVYCIGSKSLDRYIKVTDNKDFIYNFSKSLTGNYTIEDLDKRYKQQGIKFDVAKIVNILCRSGLIVNSPYKVLEKQEMESLSFKLFEINIENKYDFFCKLSHIIFPYIFYLSIIIILTGFICFLYKYKVFFDSNMYKINNSYELGIIFMIIICSVSIIIHEFSHAFVACKYKLKPKKMIISLYLLVSPIVYLKIPGIYTLKPRETIALWSAGMY